MKGKISKIWDNKLGDGRTYMTLSIDGERYNVWDKKYHGSFKEGDTVDYEFRKSGKFNNIHSISKVGAEPKVNPTYNDLNGNGIDPVLRKDLEIVRMSCLKTALYATQDLSELPIEKKADKIIEVARKLEQYVTDFGEIPAIDDDQDDGNGHPEIKRKSY